MLMLEAAAVVVLLGLLVFAAATFLMSHRGQKTEQEPVAAGHWRVGHYDAGGATRVVVQKVSATGATLLDEHVVAELPRDAPDFDERFLEAMSTARQRQALFETEES